MEPIIQFSGADILGGDSAVIYGLDMAIYPGDFVYVVGKVGSGKTSIIRTMTAENRLLSGEGSVCGFNLRTLRQLRHGSRRQHRRRPASPDSPH